jgi:hypothetical protein
MQKRNKARKMINAINPEDPIFLVAISPSLINEVNEGCHLVDNLVSELEKLLGL